MSSVWAELRRRNVVKVAVAYAIVGWLLVEVASVLFETFEAPAWVMKVFATVIIMGFPLAMFFAWAYELTPEGLKKEKDVDRSQSITHVTGRNIDYIIIAALILGLGFFAFDKFVLGPSRDAELVQATTEAVTERVTEAGKEEIANKSIAVLAFTDLSPQGGSGVFLRRHLRRTAKRAGQDTRSPGGGADLIVSIQGPEPGYRRYRPTIECGPRSGRQRPQGGHSNTHHCPACRRQQRLSSLVGDL